ncbi:TPA: hypothetical protein MA058_003480 [Klebsiella pneumoniae]|nr:hypothetical protein [Klebsiella pneumoniae]
MKTINIYELKDEDKYCPYCGGFINFKEYVALLVYPPLKQYFCLNCKKVALTVRDSWRNEE